MKICTLASLALPVALAGCSDSTNNAIDLAKAPADMATGPAKIEGCADADFLDETAASAARTITPWDPSLGKRCLTISVGQTVTWSPAPSSTHPLVASGGDSPNPITNTAMTTFANAGTFGFHCGIHGSLMHGAIKVVP